MNKNKIELKNLIEIVKTGNRSDIKKAQKEIAKIKFRKSLKNFYIFLHEIKKFDEIKDIDHKMYFINTLKRPIINIGEDNLKLFLDFILKTIQNPSGKIRQSIIKAYSHLNWDIYNALENKFDRNDKDKKELEELYSKNRKIFFDFVDELYKLGGKYYESNFKKYKYVSSLPIGIYKSIQKLLFEEVFRTDFVEVYYRKFFFEKNGRILLEDKELDKKIRNFLKKYRIFGLNVDKIKNLVWDDNLENPSEGFIEFQKEIMEYIYDSNLGRKDEKKLQDVVKIIIEMWNGYPHASLDGKTPKEMLFKKEESSDEPITFPFSKNIDMNKMTKGELFNLLKKASGGGNVPSPIEVLIKYDDVLECLTGVTKEKMFLQEFASFEYLLQNILMSHPKIVERYKATETEILINGKSVEGYEILYDGDIVEFIIKK